MNNLALTRARLRWAWMRSFLLGVHSLSWPAWKRQVHYLLTPREAAALGVPWAGLCGGPRPGRAEGEANPEVSHG